MTDGEKKPKRALVWRSFLEGWVAATCVVCIGQDLLGKKGYIEYLQEHWVPSYITGPISTFCLAWSLVKAVSLAREEMNR